MRHRIKHHVNRPILHMGLVTDRQMLPAVGLVTLAAGWGFAGSGGLVARVAVAALMLLPVGVMVVDNRMGGIVISQVKAWIAWRREPRIFVPGHPLQTAHGLVLIMDAQDQLVLERERRARLDLEAVFGDG